MADEEQKRIQAEKDRKKAEVRARLEAAAQAKKGGGKKGFMTPARKKKLRTLLRKKAAEELKKEQERKAEERKKTISERCGAQKPLDGINEAVLMQICKEYFDRIAKLESEKYDMEYDSRHKELKINELNMQVNDMRGKFIKPPLKKVSRFEYGKFEKLMRAAKKADNDFRANLKSVGPSTKFKLDEDVKEKKAPEWANKENQNGPWVLKRENRLKKPKNKHWIYVPILDFSETNFNTLVHFITSVCTKGMEVLPDCGAN